MIQVCKQCTEYVSPFLKKKTSNESKNGFVYCISMQCCWNSDLKPTPKFQFF